MSSLYNTNAPKKPTNLTINTDLLNQAKDMNINISSILEIALANVVKQRKKEKWVEENRNAVKAYNEYV